MFPVLLVQAVKQAAESVVATCFALDLTSDGCLLSNLNTESSIQIPPDTDSDDGVSFAPDRGTQLGT